MGGKKRCGMGGKRGRMNAERGMLEGGMERKKTGEEEEEEGGWKDGLEAGAGKKKTKQSGQIRFGVEGSEQSDYSN